MSLLRDGSDHVLGGHSEDAVEVEKNSQHRLAETRH